MTRTEAYSNDATSATPSMAAQKVSTPQPRRKTGSTILSCVVPVGPTDPVLLFDNNRPVSSVPSLLTIAEVAEFLQISTSGVRRLQHQRQIPFIKVGGSVRFATSDLLSYVDRQRVEPIGK